MRVLKQETVKLMACNAIGDLDVPMVRSNNPALALEVETFPGQVKKWGLTFLINTKDVEGFRAAGSLNVGRDPQHLLLDRPQATHHGRRHDADPAYRRSPRTRNHDRLRAGTLCNKIARRKLTTAGKLKEDGREQGSRGRPPISEALTGCSRTFHDLEGEAQRGLFCGTGRFGQAEGS